MFKCVYALLIWLCITDASLFFALHFSLCLRLFKSKLMNDHYSPESSMEESGFCIAACGKQWRQKRNAFPSFFGKSRSLVRRITAVSRKLFVSCCVWIVFSVSSRFWRASSPKKTETVLNSSNSTKISRVSNICSLQTWEVDKKYIYIFLFLGFPQKERQALKFTAATVDFDNNQKWEFDTTWNGPFKTFQFQDWLLQSPGGWRLSRQLDSTRFLLELTFNKSRRPLCVKVNIFFCMGNVSMSIEVCTFTQFAWILSDPDWIVKY